MAGLLKEIWINHVERDFWQKAGFLSTVDDWSEYVGNNVINFTAAGGSPAVTKNNNTFPLAITSISDTNVGLTLDHYTTDPTHIEDAENRQLGYDKVASDTEGHQIALVNEAMKNGAYNFGPSVHAANTPVLPTTGTAGAGGWKAIKSDEIFEAQLYMDDKGIPQEGRHLVLHPQHARDLYKEDQQLYKDLFVKQGAANVKIATFQIHIYSNTPYYADTGGTKIAYGAVPSSDDGISSLFFHNKAMMRCEGDTKMFVRIDDPQYAGTIMNFQKFFLSMPKRAKYYGAIRSDK